MNAQPFTVQSELGSVVESLPAQQIDIGAGYYSRDSVRRVAWVRPVTVCECEAPAAMLRSCNRAELAVDFWRSVVVKNPLYDAEKECFIVIFLNRKNAIVGWNLVSLGSQTGTIAAPREILRACLVANACAFICMHNHPSGDPAPSAPDMQCTRLIREASRTVDLQFVDHVIVGDVHNDPMGNGYFSFREAALI